MNPAEVLQQLEADLLKFSTRKKAGRLTSLLADGFREFGSSGQVNSKSQVIPTLESESPVLISIQDSTRVRDIEVEFKRPDGSPSNPRSDR